MKSHTNCLKPWKKLSNLENGKHFNLQGGEGGKFLLSKISIAENVLIRDWDQNKEYQPPFADSYADIIANLITFAQFLSTVDIFWLISYRAEQILT